MPTPDEHGSNASPAPSSWDKPQPMSLAPNSQLPPTKRRSRKRLSGPTSRSTSSTPPSKRKTSSPAHPEKKHFCYNIFVGWKNPHLGERNTQLMDEGSTNVPTDLCPFFVLLRGEIDLGGIQNNGKMATCNKQVGEGWKVHDEVYIYICICQYDLYVYTVWYIVLPYAYCTHIHGSCILLFVDSCINACIFTHPFVRSFVSTCIHSLKHVWMSYASTYVTNKFLTYDWFEWIFGEITSDHRVWCESIKMKLNHTSTPYPMTKLRPFVMSLICDVMVTCCAFPRRWAHSLTPDYKL